MQVGGVFWTFARKMVTQFWGRAGGGAFSPHIHASLLRFSGKDFKK